MRLLHCARSLGDTEERLLWILRLELAAIRSARDHYPEETDGGQRSESPSSPHWRRRRTSSCSGPLTVCWSQDEINCLSSHLFFTASAAGRIFRCPLVAGARRHYRDVVFIPTPSGGGSWRCGGCGLSNRTESKANRTGTKFRRCAVKFSLQTPFPRPPATVVNVTDWANSKLPQKRCAVRCCSQAPSYTSLHPGDRIGDNLFHSFIAAAFEAFREATRTV